MTRRKERCPRCGEIFGIGISCRHCGHIKGEKINSGLSFLSEIGF